MFVFDVLWEYSLKNTFLITSEKQAYTLILKMYWMYKKTKRKFSWIKGPNHCVIWLSVNVYDRIKINIFYLFILLPHANTFQCIIKPRWGFKHTFSIAFSWLHDL